MSTIRSSPDAKSAGVWNSKPTSSSASSWFGATRSGSPASPSRSGSPSESSTVCRRARRASRSGRRIPVLGHVARQAACEHGRGHAAHQVRELGRDHLELGRLDRRAVLDDLGRGPERRVDEQGRRARLVLDPHEVVEDARRRELLDDARAGAPAREAGREHRLTERLERARHVDALSARLHETLGAAVAEADLEVRDAQRLVDRRVQRHRHDHGASLVDRRRGAGGARILGGRWRPARSPRGRERGPDVARRANAARAPPACARLSHRPRRRGHGPRCADRRGTGPDLVVLGLRPGRVRRPRAVEGGRIARTRVGRRLARGAVRGARHGRRLGLAARVLPDRARRGALLRPRTHAHRRAG